MTTDNVCFYLQNRLIQTNQTGGQWYSDTSPFSIASTIIFFRPPPGWIGPDPSKGSEVFVGKAPRDCFEDELVPVNSVRLSYKGRRIQGNLNEGKFSAIDFVVRSDQLPFKLSLLFAFVAMKITLMRRFNCTEPYPAVRVSWSIFH